MSTDVHHFTPRPPTQFLHLRCPKDDGENHLSLSIRLPVSISRLTELAKTLPDCFCGEALVVGDAAPVRPPGPVYRGDAPEGDADGEARMWPPRGVGSGTPRGGFGDR